MGSNQSRNVLILTSIALAAILVFSPMVADALHVTSHNKSPGAIFTTTPDGSVVNENVHYNAKIQVYLDGGPGPNAPSTAAGLAEGWWVFQITDPSGKFLLSEDPSKCRVVNVSSDGVITDLVLPGELYDPTDSDGDGNPDDDTPLGLSDTYKTDDPNGNGKIDVTCHFDDDEPHPTNPGVAGGTGRHDTNVDSDHGGSPTNAIVVQMMPFLDTPNNGGVYKAWMTPYQTYFDEGLNCDGLKGRDLKFCEASDATELLNSQQIIKVKGNDVGFKPDPGFGPSNHESKTDNFKVIDVEGPNECPPGTIPDPSIPDPQIPEDCIPVPPQELGTIEVKKFHDLNANGEWDELQEPEITGWQVDFTDPNSVDPQNLYTPEVVLLTINGDYVFDEENPAGWVHSVSILDNTDLGTTDPVTVSVASFQDEFHTVIFGNFQPVSVSVFKFEDLNGNGENDDEPALAGFEFCISGVDSENNAITTDVNGAALECQTTGDDGTVSWGNLQPGTYTVEEQDKAGWHSFSTNPQSTDPLSSGDVAPTLEFGNFQLVMVHAFKFFDFDGDGERDLIANGDANDEPALEGILMCISDTDGNTVYDINGDEQLCQLTNSDGLVWWDELPPGTYVVTEDLSSSINAVGLTQTTPTSIEDQTVTVQSGGEETVTFGNFGLCNGLTPGFWKNHLFTFDPNGNSDNTDFTREQTLQLLQGTIVEDALGAVILPEITQSDIDHNDSLILLAHDILKPDIASDPLAKLKKFKLANQLTLNLTQLGFVNPVSGEQFGSLFGACILDGGSFTFGGDNGLTTVNWSGTLGEALDEAFAICDDPGAFDESYILFIKDVLDAFANFPNDDP